MFIKLSTNLYTDINTGKSKLPIFAIMALRKFIYVFVLPFLSILLTTDCSADVEKGKKLNAAYDIRESYRDCQTPQGLVNGLYRSADEGLPASLERNSNPSVRTQARERNNLLFWAFHSENWFPQSSFHISFIPALRVELHMFISITQLLVFPKHWFW